jgi:hypothetical protein
MVNCLRCFACGLTLALLAGACRQSLEPGLPAGAVPFEPPAVYAIWWTQVESCAGFSGLLSGSYSSVRWYQVPGATAFFLDGPEPIQGRWSADGNTITLAGRLVDDSMLVRHEELHALLRSGDHPSLYFVTRCGALVYPP